MSDATGQESKGWGAPKGAPQLAPNFSPDDLTLWQETTTAVRVIAESRGWSKSSVARLSDVPMGTLSPWYDGTYTGRLTEITARVKRWLASFEESARLAGVKAPGFVTTRTAGEVIDTLVYAQALGEMVVITLGAGMGKTITCRHFAATRPHVFLVTMRPTTTNVFAAMQELALVLGVTEKSPARLDRSVGERLKRNGRETLLIVDEAQNATDNTVNQLRYFLDEFGCGIALVGNEELYGRFGGAEPKAAYAQLHRRIGKRLRRLIPLQADIDALVAAWNIEDQAAANLARAIGRKPGALSQISKTLVLAGMLAAGEGKPLAVDHVRQAWTNRGGEELRLAAVA